MFLKDLLLPALEQHQARGLYRQLRQRQTPQHPLQQVNGQWVCSFSSNDYLGLADHPSLQEAAILAIEKYGFGSGSAELINGYTDLHAELEYELARWTGRPRALLFSTGFMANIGVISALSNAQDLILEDRLNHASLLDGARLAGARLSRYHHLDTLHADTLFKKNTITYRRRFIVTDGVFSMDGDLAPLQVLAQLAKQHQAYLMVDDAHGFGVLGTTGAGIVEALNLSGDDVPILVGTLGKAFGSFGAFVAGDDALIETCQQFARSYIFTTAMPPACVAASLAALHLIQQDHARRAHLQGLIQACRAQAQQLGLALMDSLTPIQPIVIGDSQQAWECSQRLFEAGFYVPAIRPPSVAAGTARLRITLTAAHTLEQLSDLLNTLVIIMRDIDGSSRSKA